MTLIKSFVKAHNSPYSNANNLLTLNLKMVTKNLKFKSTYINLCVSFASQYSANQFRIQSTHIAKIAKNFRQPRGRNPTTQGQSPKLYCDNHNFNNSMWPEHDNSVSI